jgi:hypothetical protein
MNAAEESENAKGMESTKVDEINAPIVDNVEECDQVSTVFVTSCGKSAVLTTDHELSKLEVCILMDRYENIYCSEDIKD